MYLRVTSIGAPGAMPRVSAPGVIDVNHLPRAPTGHRYGPRTERPCLLRDAPNHQVGIYHGGAGCRVQARAACLDRGSPA